MSPSAERAGVLPVLPILSDSHADPFLGAYVCAPGGAPLAVAHTAFLPLFTAETFLDAQGRIHPQIVQALATLRLLLYCADDAPGAIPQTVMASTFSSPGWGPSWRANPWLKGTPLLVLVGEVTARFTYDAIPPVADIDLDLEPSRWERVPRFEPGAMVSRESFAQVVDARLAPLFRGLALLREYGLGPLVLHSISPCTPDDQLYQRTYNRESRAQTRYKTIIAYNDALKARAARDGFLFIDRWDEFTEGGLAREGYLADTVHVREQHMRETLVRYYDLTVGAGSGSGDYAARLAAGNPV